MPCRAYCGRQRHAVHAVEASQLLRQACDCIVGAAEAVREPLQAEQELRRQKNENAQELTKSAPKIAPVAFKKRSGPDYGPSM